VRGVPFPFAPFFLSRPFLRGRQRVTFGVDGQAQLSFFSRKTLFLLVLLASVWGGRDHLPFSSPPVRALRARRFSSSLLFFFSLFPSPIVVQGEHRQRNGAGRLVTLLFFSPVRISPSSSAAETRPVCRLEEFGARV